MEVFNLEIKLILVKLIHLIQANNFQIIIVHYHIWGFICSMLLKNTRLGFPVIMNPGYNEQNMTVPLSS
jgi:hypothetical protein